MSRDLGGFSMFELFKTEAETHCAALNEGLLAIEADPDDVERIVPIMRAAHSIKGAARIIGLDPVVTLAHAMEECLVAAQKGLARLTPARVDQLLRGVDVLQEIATLSETQAPEWAAAQTQAIATLTAALRSPPPAEDDVAHEAVAASLPPTSEPPPETGGAGGTALGDFSMFELFKTEAETHCAVLNEGLLAIEADPDDVERIVPIMRAAHSIKGAARIIGLDPVVTLAHAMEDCLVAAQKGSARLTPGRVDQLLRGVDVLQEIATLSETQAPEWAAAQGPAIEALTAALGSPPPAEAPEEGAPPPAAPSEPAAPAPSVPAAPAPGAPAAAAPDTEPHPDDATVRVRAGSLDRMMQLASESMIAARRLERLRGSFTQLRESQRLLAEGIGRSHERQRTRRAERVDLDELRRLGAEAGRQLAAHFEDLERASWRTEQLSTALYNEVLGSRMRPFADGVQAFPRMVRDLARSLGKRVRLEIEGEKVPVDRDVLARLEAPLNHILRNSVDHGIETKEERRAAGKPEAGHIVLAARHHAGMLTVQVCDDGRGIDPESIRAKVVERGLADEKLAAGLSGAELMDFMFLPGFSTAREVTEVSGRGVGLDVVHSMVQEVSGSVRAESEPGRSTTFTLQLPVTLSVIRAVLADIEGEPYAFPLPRVSRVLRVPREEARPVEGRLQFRLDGESVGLVSAAEILGFGAKVPAGDELSVVLLGQSGQWCGLTVDRFAGEQDLVVRPLDRRLGRVPHISAAAVLEEGDPLLIVDVEDLLHAVRQRLGEGRLRGLRALASAEETDRRRRILVVDDSITVREVERQLLMRKGYAVDVAVDGRDGWNTLRAGAYDLLITDVDMPRMNGIELIRIVRAHPPFAELPIIVVSYKDRAEDRQRGLEVGANAYLTKSSFHDDSLVTTVADLIGEAVP